MKIIFFIFISFLLLEGCGKKSEPEYKAKSQQEILNFLYYMSQFKYISQKLFVGGWWALNKLYNDGRI